MSQTLVRPDTLLVWRDAACAAAIEAADILLSWRSRFSVREKGRADLVTEADLAAQKSLRNQLLGQFPDHGFIGEEDGIEKGPDPGAPPTWIVDPLDGTTNYVHDFPFFAVSLGLQVAGELVIGVVYDPSRREMFRAAKGLGADLNGSSIRVSGAGALDNSLVATGFPANLSDKEYLLEWWRRLGPRCHGLRRTGSTAINLAYVAAGRFDAYYGFDNHAWDVAGGVVVVLEAGGRASNIAGGSFDAFKPDCLVTNAGIHQEVLDFFGEAI